MKKQFTLNLDALLIIAIVFLVSVGFIKYQHNEYSDLLEDHIQLQWQAQDMEIEVKSLGLSLKRCNDAG